MRLILPVCGNVKMLLSFFSLKEMLEALFFYDYNPVFWFMYQLILLVALAIITLKIR